MKHLADVDLERSVLAALVNAPRALILDTAAPAETFSAHGNRAMYEAIKGAAAAATGDFVTDFMVRAQVAQQNSLKRCGGEFGLKAIFELAKPTTSPAQGMKRLRSVARNRAIHEALQRAQCEIAEGRADAAMGELQQLFGAAAGDDDGMELFTTPEIVAAATEHYVKASQKRDITIPVITSAIGDLPPGSLLTIGGDTNAGKSSLALYIAERYHAAGVVPGIISLEDPAAIWGDRVQAMRSGVSFSAVQRGEATRDDLDKATTAASELADHKGRWAVLRRFDCATVLAAMRRCVADGARILVVDYHQQIDRPDMRGASQHEKYGESAKELKREAGRLGVPLILCSQLSRPADKTGKRKEPNRTTLKGSGDLENVSEFVILLWQETDHTDAPTIGKVAKAKSSSKRPRFTIVRNDAGAIINIVRRDEKKQQQRQGYGGSYAGRPNPADFADDDRRGGY